MTQSQLTDQSLRVLGKFLLFQALEEHGRREIAARAHRRSYMAGEVIFHAGAPGQNMMAVLVGTVRITYPVASGKHLVLADLTAGEVFGEIALIDGRERTADATALTNCELLVLERRDVLPMLQTHPEVCIKLLELLCATIRRADERMSDIAFHDIPTRLAKTLLRRAGEAADSARGARISLSQGELANMIGGTRENVNRCLREWQRRGIIDLQSGWIVIRGREALQRVADLA